MSKPVNKIEFWKERIDTAVKDQYTVYVCGEKMWRDINEEHKRIFDKVIPEDAKVLDAGCGYGRWADSFTNYTGIDFSPDFIAKAKEKYPHKEFIKGDLKNLPFEDKEFDWAFCISIKKMIEDNLGIEEWEKMEKELKRVAKNVLLMEYEDPKPYEIL